jgi:hypothetical protein
MEDHFHLIKDKIRNKSKWIQQTFHPKTIYQIVVQTSQIHQNMMR